MVTQVERDTTPPSARLDAVAATAVPSSSPPPPGSVEALTTPSDSLTVVEQLVQTAPEDAQSTWMAAADRLARQYTRLVVMPQTEGALVDDIKSSALGTLLGEPTGIFFIHYDVKLSGEAVTSPHIRICPFQDDLYKQMAGAVLTARWQGPSDQSPTLQAGLHCTCYVVVYNRKNICFV